MLQCKYACYRSMTIQTLKLAEKNKIFWKQDCYIVVASFNFHLNCQLQTVNKFQVLERFFQIRYTLYSKYQWNISHLFNFGMCCNIVFFLDRFSAPTVAAFSTSHNVFGKYKIPKEKRELINHSRVRGIEILRNPKLNKVELNESLQFPIFLA